MNSTNIINSFASFALGYPLKFVREAFSECPKHIIDHLETKFIHCYNERGSYGAMIAFWSELSTENRNILAKYITKENEQSKK